MAPGVVSTARQPTLLTTPVKEQGYWRTVGAALYHDKLALLAIGLLSVIILLSATAPWLATNVTGFDPTDTNLRMRSKPPTWAAAAWPLFQAFSRSCQTNQGCQWALWGEMSRSSLQGVGQCFLAELGQCSWLGTDQAGRDVLTRGLYGGRISLRIGFYVAVVSLTLGVVMGLISGYYAATLIDDLINAIIMTLSSIPLLFLLIILSRIFAPGPEGLALLIGLFGWMGLSRLIRGQIFSVREREFIYASRAIGSSPWRIMFQHILPNIASIVIVSAIFNVAGAIIAEASLSYLGVGIGPPHASWGNMMEGSLGNFTNAPWLVLAPGIFIFFTTLSIYLIGDGLRDALDPTLKNKR
ncbi:MAG: ABC transporter permease [Caldilineaceae bacterium]|nr:ABC transporter permease [Caldilineaceae bacterium]